MGEKANLKPLTIIVWLLNISPDNVKIHLRLIIPLFHNSVAE